MTQIPLLSGIIATEKADFGLSYPINLEPIPTETGLSKGYVRSAMGATTFGEAPGVDRGGIVWNNVHYRVSGTKLVRVSAAGEATVIGDVGDGGPVALDYGFDRLAIQSGTSLYYWDGVALTQVTDPDLGPCHDVVWFNGQYFSTDGTYIVATQLSDPTAVDPTKYGSAESDPDMVVGLLRNRNELAVLGSNTIEFFDYIGGTGFPLQVSSGATIPLGCVGPRAKCIFSQSFAFVGAGRNQAAGVWLAGSGTAQKLSTRAIDDMIAAETNPEAIEVEARVSRDESRLYVHLSNKTLVYLRAASVLAGREVWYVCKSGRGMDEPYRLRHAVLTIDGDWIVGDCASGALGKVAESDARHFGDPVGWQFDTLFVYNSARGGVIHTMELVGLPGRGAGARPVAFMSFTQDGETWTQERTSVLGLQGQRGKRCQWRPHKRFSNYIGIRFRGSSDSLVGWAALEVEVEALST